MNSGVERAELGEDARCSLQSFAKPVYLARV
jgi:hypothetical protein